MRVRDMRSNHKIRFEEISVGTVICFPTGLWIKVKPFIPDDDTSKFGREHPMNLVRLEDGLFARASAEEIVSPVDLKVEIHDYSPDCERSERRDDE